MGMLIPTNIARPNAPPSPPLPEDNELPTARVPQNSTVMNVVLHIMYGMPCIQYAPTLEAVDAALNALCSQYGVVVQAYAGPHLPLRQLLLSYAPFRPLDAYALAAQHGLDDIAVQASPHLLAYDLSRLPDVTAQKMGPIYLKRLFLLHQGRLVALRNILFRPPAEHAPVMGCSTEQRAQLTRAWALAVAQLVWDVLPSESHILLERHVVSYATPNSGVSTSALQSLLEPIGAAVSCPSCAAVLQQRVQEVTYEWSSVKVRVSYSTAYEH